MRTKRPIDIADLPTRYRDRCRCGAVFVAIALAVAGCGGTSESFTRAAVQGSVTLDNQPLDGAVIRFVPIGNTSGPKTEFLISKGAFAADQAQGPPVGLHRVEIDRIDDQWQHDDEQALQKLQASPQTTISRVTLPARYHSESSLTATFEASTVDTPTVLTFPLSSRPQ